MIRRFIERIAGWWYKTLFLAILRKKAPIKPPANEALIYGREGAWSVRLMPFSGEDSVHGPFRRMSTAESFVGAEKGRWLVSKADRDIVGGEAVRPSKRRPWRRFMKGPRN